MSIGKSLLAMTPAELVAFVVSRRSARQRKIYQAVALAPAERTIGRVASALNVTKQEVENELKN
jgi:hypothetical protein